MAEPLETRTVVCLHFCGIDLKGTGWKERNSQLGDTKVIESSNANNVRKNDVN